MGDACIAQLFAGGDKLAAAAVAVAASIAVGSTVFAKSNAVFFAFAATLASTLAACFAAIAGFGLAAAGSRSIGLYTPVGVLVAHRAGLTLFHATGSQHRFKSFFASMFAMVMLQFGNDDVFHGVCCFAHGNSMKKKQQTKKKNGLLPPHFHTAIPSLCLFVVVRLYMSTEKKSNRVYLDLVGPSAAASVRVKVRGTRLKGEECFFGRSVNGTCEQWVSEQEDNCRNTTVDGES